MLLTNNHPVTTQYNEGRFRDYTVTRYTLLGGYWVSNATSPRVALRRTAMWHGCNEACHRPYNLQTCWKSPVAHFGLTSLRPILITRCSWFLVELASVPLASYLYMLFYCLHPLAWLFATGACWKGAYLDLGNEPRLVGVRMCIFINSLQWAQPKKGRAGGSADLALKQIYNRNRNN